jgi:phenylacetate-coenzyme A ligase PaaK-like adenylate-forming protein
MPIVRYDVGDRVEFCNNISCSCGKKSKIIKILEGRKVEEIKINESLEISPYIFYFCIEKTNEEMHNAIIQYKIIKKNNVLKFMFVIKDEYKKWSKAIINAFEKNIYKFISYGNNNVLNLEYDIVEKLEYVGNKFMTFENKDK